MDRPLSEDPCAAVEWAARSIESGAPDGAGAPAGREVEAPVGWSDVAVATVASRYLARLPDGSQTAGGPEPIPVAGHLAMVAAVQPLVSGGVSKTVNLPERTSVEAIEAAFVDAWRMGLKAISVYRDGSKIQQPLQGVEE